MTEGYTAVNTTDCDDSNPEASPSAESWFATPLAGGGFDYDCDGVSTLESAEIATLCVYQSGFCAGGQSGWLGGVPGCGAVGVWQAGCYSSPGSPCVNWTMMQAQGCR